MSYESWKAIHYPVDANSPDALERPITHSLRKWGGLRPAVLEAHGLHLDGEQDVYGADDEKVLEVSSTTCALCVKHCGQGFGCEDCALCQVRGGVPCSKLMASEGRSPWGVYIDGGDSEPMIFWLKKAAEKGHA